MAEIVIKTTLKDGTPVEWGKRWIKDIRSTVQSTTNPSQIQYGAVDTSGSATILDIDGSIYKNIRSGNLPKDNIELQLFLNGTKIRTHIVTESNYNINTNLLNLTLRGVLYKLALEEYVGIPLTRDKTALSITQIFLQDIGYSSSQIDASLSGNIIYGSNQTGTVKDYLAKIELPFAYVRAGRKKIDILNDICALAQLQVFETNSGELKFVSARPVVSLNSSNVIVINSNKQYSHPETSIILDNEVSSVGVNKNIYSLQFSKQDDVSVNLFDQTQSVGNVRVDGEEKQFYSGLLSDYTKNVEYVQNASGDFYVYGIYPYDSPVYGSSDRGIVCKYSIDASEFILDETLYSMGNFSNFTGALLVPLVTSSYKNKNILKTSQSFSSNSKFALNATTESLGQDINNDLVRALYRPTFVDNESAALNNLCVMSGTSIQSIRSSLGSGSNTIVQIVKTGNILDCYFVINNISMYKYDIVSSTYTGDLKSIDLSDTISMFIRSLKRQNVDINSGADFTLPQSELLQDGAAIDGSNIYDVLSDNIKSDYATGIQDATVTISLANYYDTNKNLIKDGSKGELLTIGDVVRIDKNDNGDSFVTDANGKSVYWKVTGSTIRKAGTPFVDLELMQVIDPTIKTLIFSSDQYTTLTITRTSSPTGGSIGVLENNADIYIGDVLQISASAPSGYSINITANGQNITNNSTITVSSDVAIVATAVETATYTLSKGSSTVTRTASPAGATLGELTNSDTLYEGDVLSITYTGDVRTYTIRMGGSVVASGSNVSSISQQLTVSGNVSVSITAKAWHWVSHGSSSAYTSKTFSAPSSNSWEYDSTTGSIGIAVGLLANNTNRKNWSIRLHYYNPYLRDSFTTEWFYGIEGTDGANLDRSFVGSGCAIGLGWQTPPEIYLNDPYGTNWLLFDVKSNDNITITNAGYFEQSNSSGNYSRNYITQVDFFVEQYEYS